MAHILKCRGYGRYVDDFYVVSADKGWLYSIVPKVREFLASALGLAFHDGKMQVTSVWHGAEFLGAWLKPHMIYASRDTVLRMMRKLCILARSRREKWYASLNSYCGVLSHWNNFKLRRLLLNENPEFGEYGMFTMDYKKYHAVRSLFMKKKNDPRHTMVLKQRMLVMQV